ncbi:ATP-binding protein [Streptomyces sp. NPDC052043]|uniref:ATP-binding protein n=1 Tax=Streptomyces sp. NPDC052043 TaxID=3365684 RepID=UPI0037D7FEAD
MTFPQAPALPDELDRLMRRMRLPYMRKAAPDVLATARAQRWDPAEVLRLLISEEVTGRDAATRRLRRHSANFPTGKTLASWRAEDSTIPEPTQNSLITLEWIGRAKNLVIAGPSGTGKSHFTEGLAQAAIEKDLRVAWFTLETLAAATGKSKVDGSTARTVARICRAAQTVQPSVITPTNPGTQPVGADGDPERSALSAAGHHRRASGDPGSGPPLCPHGHPRHRSAAKDSVTSTDRH